ncbi:primosomal protein N' [Clostridium sp. SYSU_GA19001]|uniref:primosomal protein N' n=1 Tax=Clostridium caldaquaticum TaxID=2940653 RepID=UPI0020775721|nr:primosomal protein N' [Clostridium caldaquaticum]
MYKYAGIIVNNNSIQLDKVFIYYIPKKLREIIKVGFRVKIPFGVGNKIIDGFIVALYEEYSSNSNIKEILELSDEYPILRLEDIELIKFMREKYLCTYLEAIKVIIPTGIIKGINRKTSDVIYVGKNLDGKYQKENYKLIYSLIAENNGKYNKNEFSKKFGVSLSSLNTLLKYGYLTTEKITINRYDERIFSSYPEKVLNKEQKYVFDRIVNSNNNNFLIHGITGSGKTEIYMNLVNNMINNGKDSIILVPEISLTPQMVERFKGRFGKNIAVFHSKLSEGERFDEWFRVKNGEVKVAIGARSAVFLPFNNLGLIIIDEEHEHSYKSDSDPKYNALEIAQYRCSIEGSKFVLGSATPSVETYYKTTLGELELLVLKNRADNAVLPRVELVDMREELVANNKSIFSKKLYSEIEKSLINGEQIILFLNRRGYSTFVSCRKCGFVFKCNNCDISLTYHNEDGILSCHYCGSKRKVTNVCPKCKSKYVKYFGVGTEKVEQEIKKYFPMAKTLRMDFDTTRKKNSYETIYNLFKDNKADILIGTQMIAKGLDFKNVTLVGVIAADLSLNLPDYRSAERTFQLITQVGGRAGRGEKPGKVIVQTYNTENYSILNSIANDYKNFYNQEISIRRDMGYPPFSKILLINMSSKNENLLIKNIQNVGVILKNILEHNDKIEMLGPCPCAISKINEHFRWQILLKGDINNKLANDIKNTVYETLKEVYTEIRVSLDINPNSLI